MASVSQFLSLPFLFSLLLFAYPILSANTTAPSPSLPPQPPAVEISKAPASTSSAPSPAPSFSSPPAPPSSDLAPTSPSHAPTPQEQEKKSPSRAPAEAGDINHENQPHAATLKAKENSSGGMSGGQKAGVAVGVIAGACIVGAGAVVYKKRQQNIQRSQYGYSARRELL